MFIFIFLIGWGGGGGQIAFNLWRESPMTLVRSQHSTFLIPRSPNKIFVNGCLTLASNQLFQLDRLTSSLRVMAATTQFGTPEDLSAVAPEGARLLLAHAAL